MEMTWMETIQLLGLDVLALMLMALVVLDVLEHAVHAAWVTVRSRKPSPARTAAAGRVGIGGIEHV
jgi:hypothetical protein